MILFVSDLGPNKKVQIAHAGLLKVGRKKAAPPKEAVASLSKGERRKLRKDLVKVGRSDLMRATL